MPSRRLLTFLARCVLAWFVLHLGAGIAAPVLHPQGMQVVCAGNGLKVVPDGGGDARLASAAMDCPLCSPALAPPPVPAVVPLLPVAAPLFIAQHSPEPSRTSDAPPPARGPPAFVLA